MKKLLAALLLSVAAFPASATPFNFSYLFASTGRTASGVLEGTLGSGGLVALTGVDSFAVDGVAVNDTFTFGSGNSAALGVDDAPALNLDGSLVNFYILNSAGSQIFSAVVTPEALSLVGFLPIGATTGYGGSGSYETYVQANFSVAAADAVPEPAMLGLFGLGAIGLGLSRRRRV